VILLVVFALGTIILQNCYPVQAHFLLWTLAMRLVPLTVKDLAGTRDRIPVDYKRLPDSVVPGSLIFLNGGFIQLQVEKVSGEAVYCRTVIGAPLLSFKGLTLPGVRIFAAAVSETDLEFVAFALREGADAFGVSFAETADDILKVKRLAREKGHSAYVVAKIERAYSIDNFAGILISCGSASKERSAAPVFHRACQAPEL